MSNQCIRKDEIWRYPGAAGGPRPAVTASRLLALRANRHSAVPGL